MHCSLYPANVFMSHIIYNAMAGTIHSKGNTGVPILPMTIYITMIL